MNLATPPNNFNLVIVGIYNDAQYQLEGLNDLH